MIIRIVKMTFQPDKVDDFLGIFNEQRENISAFEGCGKLELWEDTERDNVFFTYSEWKAPADLEAYRSSEVFLSTWSRAKQLFAEKPEAWSLQIAS